jgi:hypothetical protein
MAYYQITNTGKGFITHQENESAHVAGYPGEVWITENTAWANRVGAIQKTKSEAQTLVNSALLGKLYPEGHVNEGQQVVLNLP